VAWSGDLSGVQRFALQLGSRPPLDIGLAFGAALKGLELAESQWVRICIAAQSRLPTPPPPFLFQGIITRKHIIRRQILTQNTLNRPAKCCRWPSQPCMTMAQPQTSGN